MAFKFPKDSPEYYTKLSKLSKEDFVLDEENDFRFIVILDSIIRQVENIEDIVTFGESLNTKKYVRLWDVLDIVERYIPKKEVSLEIDNETCTDSKYYEDYTTSTKYGLY